jgi:flagellar hook assembly protein FlgD
MRIGILVTCGLAFLILGGTCLPLVDNTATTAPAGTKLAVALTAPTAAATVAQGTPVHIAWTASNLTGESATVTLIAESRADLARTTLVADVALTGTGGSGTYTWQTNTASGAYALYARITAGTQTAEVKSPLITIDAPPKFTFSAPTTDASIDPNATPVNPITISWTASDNNGTARIGLDPDAEHGGDANDTTDRNEVYIKELTLPTTDEPNSLAWAGTDTSGNVVEPGTYYVFAIATDGVNPNVIVEAAGRITVLDTTDPNADKDPLTVTEPNEDVQFLTSDASLTLKYEVYGTADVLVDLKIDRDDSHTNGNEITIFAQRLVPEDTGLVTETWTGTDSSATNVPDGIYRLVAYASSGSGTPTQAQSKGLIKRRSSTDQALISLLEPGSNTTLQPGGFVTIKWRDDDPSDSATIRLTLDDDANPAEATETGAAEVTILTGRAASGTGVQDTFSYQLPLATAPGTYYVFAYIERPSVLPADNVSTAAGRIIVKDPNQ